MSEELVEIVNENNEVVKVVPRSQMRREHLPHRASYIAFCNNEGRFLIEVRTLRKDYMPGKFDACVGGIVQAGEDPVISARREFAEEVGIDVDAPDCRVKLHNLGVMHIDSDPFYLFGYLFLAKGDAITRRQESEVSGIMYLYEDDIMRLEDNFAPDSLKAFKEILRRAREQGLIK